MCCVEGMREEEREKAREAESGAERGRKGRASTESNETRRLKY